MTKKLIGNENTTARLILARTDFTKNRSSLINSMTKADIETSDKLINKIGKNEINLAKEEFNRRRSLFRALIENELGRNKNNLKKATKKVNEAFRTHKENIAEKEQGITA